MKNSVVLTITSLLSILFLLLHLTDDFVHGISTIGPSLNFVVFPVITLLLYGALVLAGRRSGYIIQIVGAILALGMPAMHFRGRINDIAHASGGFFFVFTLLVLGVTGLFALILAVRGLWTLRRTQPR